MLKTSTSEMSLDRPLPLIRKRHKSLPKNQFRGLKKDEIHKQTNLYIVSMTIEELYAEILYEILHNIGCDVSYEIGKIALLSYVQDVFKLPTTKHQQILAEVEQKEPPEILLNVEVIEAKDLNSKDSNGLNDPFVTLYLASNTSHRYNTSVKRETLSPVWEEHFALPVSESVAEDTLCLEVWDFDAAETVKEKLGKIFEVKGVKGMRKLVKEIAVTATTGQHDNELIGTARVPLKSVPTAGMTMWYSLDKHNKPQRRQGVLKIRLSFGAAKHHRVAAQEHRHLLRLVLHHEIEESRVAPYWWCGAFSPQAEVILGQHVAQSGLGRPQELACLWSVYVEVHLDHRLSYQLFTSIIDRMAKCWPTDVHSEEFEDFWSCFWASTKRLLPTCYSRLRKIRVKGFKDRAQIQRISDILDLLSRITMVPLNTVNNNLDLFPEKLYQWRRKNLENEPVIKDDIYTVLHDAVEQGASDWFDQIVENNTKINGNGGDLGDLGRMQFLVKIIQLCKSDLQKAIEFYEKIFIGRIGFNYSSILYNFYQRKITEIAQNEIKNICKKSLKRLNFTSSASENDADQILTQGTTLFELYLTLQRFVVLGQGLQYKDTLSRNNSEELSNFHKWFHGAVAQWLDIAVYKALLRIEKAVEIDNLVPVDKSVKYSSSAVDTLTIFYQVKVFWQQLNWPDVEGCYTFIAKIIDDICRCCVFYAQKMAERVDGMCERSNINETCFEVSEEWCLAINNIEYVRQSLRPFTDELDKEGVLRKLSDLRSEMEADRCQKTLENVISNAIDTVQNEIIGLLETVVNKMVPSMRRLLIEGAELYNQDSNSIDRLMRYVDNNLQTLNIELNEENFARTLDIVWATLSRVLNDLIQSTIEKRRPPSFFANLHKTLNLMLGSFKMPEQKQINEEECDSLKVTERLLRLYGLETNELIHQINLDLFDEYQKVTESRFGELSVRMKFEDKQLKIEILNARNLLGMDSNGSCDPFVKIHLIPEEKYSVNAKLKTQSHNKTQFPLFDEYFVIPLTENQRNYENALILFNVKDRDLLGYNNQHIGEAMFKFDKIPDTDKALSALPQIHLQLSRPTDLNNVAIKALESRHGDKLARDFLKRFKQRMNAQ